MTSAHLEVSHWSTTVLADVSLCFPCRRILSATARRESRVYARGATCTHLLGSLAKGVQAHGLVAHLHREWHGSASDGSSSSSRRVACHAEAGETGGRHGSGVASSSHMAEPKGSLRVLRGHSGR
jgi:hypothetical protein